jgi:hypothetical protein
MRPQKGRPISRQLLAYGFEIRKLHPALAVERHRIPNVFKQFLASAAASAIRPRLEVPIESIILSESSRFALPQLYGGPQGRLQGGLNRHTD